MKNLKQLLSLQSKIPKWIHISFIVISCLGFLDSTYLTIEHFLGRTPYCNLLGGCDIVTTSEYATIIGVPVALLGSLFYLTVLILTILSIDLKNNLPIKYVSLLTIPAFAFSLWMIYLQIFVLRALCIYCIGSAIASIILFIIGIIYLTKYGKK